MKKMFEDYFSEIQADMVSRGSKLSRLGKSSGIRIVKILVSVKDDNPGNPPKDFLHEDCKGKTKSGA